MWLLMVDQIEIMRDTTFDKSKKDEKRIEKI